MPRTLTEMKEKCPALFSEYEKANGIRDRVNEEVMPLRRARDAKVREMQPLQDEVDRLGAKIRSYMPSMAELDMQISGLIKAMGGG